MYDDVWIIQRLEKVKTDMAFAINANDLADREPFFPFTFTPNNVARTQQRPGSGPGWFTPGITDGDVRAFKNEYRWQLRQAFENVSAILRRMKNGYQIEYNAYGTMSPWGPVDSGLSGWSSSRTQKDAAVPLIHVTEGSFDPRNPNLESPFAAQDLTYFRRGTIVHELSHIVLGTGDYMLGFNPVDHPYPDADARYRVVNDAYWYEVFVASDNEQQDFSRAMGFLIRDIEDRRYLDWINTKPNSWWKSLPNTTWVDKTHIPLEHIRGR